MPTKKIILESKLKGAGKTKQGLKGIDGGLKSLGKSAIGVAGAYFGAMGLISGIKGAVDAFGQQELAEKKLEAALGRTSPALLKQASALQKVTTFGDEATIEAMSLLAAFTDEEEQIKKLTPVILDLAAAKGMDLTAAADLVSKSVFSSTNALSRYGIEIEGAVGGTERLDSAVNNISALFGGQAAAQAETMSGSIGQMKNSVGDAAEAFGELLGPAVITISDALKSFAENTVEFLDWIDGINTNEEILDNFNKQTKNAEEVLQKYSESLNITVDDSKSLAENLTYLIEQAEEMNEKETFKGVAFSESARAMRDAKDAVVAYEAALESYQSTAKPLVEKPIVIVPSAQAEILDDVIIDMEIMNDLMRESFGLRTDEEVLKEKQLTMDLKRAALSGQSAIQSMKSVVRAETMEAVAGYLSSVMKNVPFPANILLAAAGGGLVAGLMDKALGAIPNKFATGADFITQGATPMLVGEAGPEHVQVTPLTPGMNQNGPQGGVTIQIQGNMIGNESFVRDTLIPEISKATNQGLA